jgi:hypothetical protein
MFPEEPVSFRMPIAASVITSSVTTMLLPEKDAGLRPIDNMILTDAGLIALQANVIENDGREGFVVLDRSIVAVNEDVDLADASAVAGDLHIVGLRDENVSGNSGATGDGGTRRPDELRGPRRNPFDGRGLRTATTRTPRASTD